MSHDYHVTCRSAYHDSQMKCISHDCHVVHMKCVSHVICRTHQWSASSIMAERGLIWTVYEPLAEYSKRP